MNKILTLPNPKLRQKAKPVEFIDKRIEKIIKEMKVVLDKSENPKGVGLAAPQLGIPLRIILVKIGKVIVPFINPEITETKGEIIEGFEGCLSVPGIYGYVKRPAIITLKAVTNLTPGMAEGHSRSVLSGTLKNIPHATCYKLQTTTFNSLPARIIQHEIDHLNGILFVDRILEQKARLLSSGAKATGGQGKFYKITGKDKEGKDLFEEVKLTL